MQHMDGRWLLINAQELQLDLQALADSGALQAHAWPLQMRSQSLQVDSEALCELRGLSGIRI